MEEQEIVIYDTSLRDGSQSEDILFSAQDKVRICRHLDDIGVGFIEGGWPGANPKDDEFFRLMDGKTLRRARLTAFCSTRRAGNRPESDPVLNGALAANTPVITLFGKSWDFHVTRALGISLEENLQLIFDSVRFLVSRVDTVFFDAEHFFDGFKANPDYARQVLQAAADGGAKTLVLCDTNGGSLMEEVTTAMRAVSQVGVDLGIHCHNDAGLALANTLAGVSAGAVHVQGTINGIGERCGNADLISILPNLILKMGRKTSVSRESLTGLCALSGFVNEMANRTPRPNQPFVGRSAFAHKGGIHVSAVMRDAATYEHIDPELVGNQRRILVSEQSGRSNLIHRFARYGMKDLDPQDPVVRKLLDRVKHLEHRGFLFDGADASFELLARRAFGQIPNYFSLRGFRVIDARRILDDGQLVMVTDATVKVSVGGREQHTAAEGTGPVHALDQALRKALSPFYSQLADMSLSDFKVRILSTGGTGAMVRVLIESMDKQCTWGTVGVSANIIEASYMALVDAVVYKLFKEKVPVPCFGENGQ